ncbi:hypothetical protein HNQ77_002932 [Silvibacterium bohemicum]|uniref:Uncharacterized protein n=1 Tax=Silvibacterium bohemicum TaxID=1577686 RepID=A0A841JUE6_9BACT|nr:hypothetical protein [Silvibacterium bohemicum]MBB6144976.1 hypothetical protein [Silvibacterium bohemicum]
MDVSLSEKVRAMALRKYVQPAKEAGKSELSIAVKDLLRDLDEIRFPGNYVPLVCNAIKTRGFQRENDLEITGIDGPQSKTSPTVVVHYRVGSEGQARKPQSIESKTHLPEDPAARAHRLTNKLRGLLKDEIAAYGGAEAFMRWVRGHDEDSE